MHARRRLVAHIPLQHKSVLTVKFDPTCCELSRCKLCTIAGFLRMILPFGNNSRTSDPCPGASVLGISQRTNTHAAAIRERSRSMTDRNGKRSLSSKSVFQKFHQSSQLSECVEQRYGFATVCRRECVYSLKDSNFSQMNLSFQLIHVAFGDCILHRLLPRVSCSSHL